MLRGAFLAGSAAALATKARPARAQTIPVADLVDRFPGVIGIYCRTLAPAPPLVAVRASEPFAAASIIKLPVMLTVYRAYERKTASPDEYVTLLPGDITEGAPILGDAPLRSAVADRRTGERDDQIQRQHRLKRADQPLRLYGDQRNDPQRRNDRNAAGATFRRRSPHPAGATSTSRHRKISACCCTRSNAARTKASPPWHHPHRAAPWCRRCSARPTAR